MKTSLLCWPIWLGLLMLTACKPYEKPKLPEIVPVLIDTDNYSVSLGAGSYLDGWDTQTLIQTYWDQMVASFPDGNLNAVTSNTGNTDYKLVVKKMILQQSSSKEKATDSNCGWLTNLLARRYTLNKLELQITLEFYKNDVLQNTWEATKNLQERLERNDCGEDGCCPSFSKKSDHVSVADILQKATDYACGMLVQRITELEF